MLRDGDGGGSTPGYIKDVVTRHRAFLKRKATDKPTFRPRKRYRHTVYKVLSMMDNQARMVRGRNGIAAELVSDFANRLTPQSASIWAGPGPVTHPQSIVIMAGRHSHTPIGCHWGRPGPWSHDPDGHDWGQPGPSRTPIGCD